MKERFDFQPIEYFTFGHIAPLCFPEIQQFYFQVADHMLSVKNEEEYKRNLAVAWTLTE